MRKRNKTTKFIALAAAALLLGSAPAYAVTGEAIGNFDSDVQASVSDTETETAGTDITLSDGTVYDTVKGVYRWTVESSAFTLNLPDGVITTGSVCATLAPTLTGVLYKNGEEVTGADLSNISSPGKYVLAVTENDDSKTKRVSFTIVSSLTGDIKEYELPADFYAVSATVDGADAVFSQTYVDMSEEGSYEIVYRAPKIDVQYTLRITLDHTAPELTFSGLTDGKANGPVTISHEEEGINIYIQRNNSKITYSDTLTDTGVYLVTAKDAAGNENTYEFVIVAYMNTNTWLLVGASGILVLALIAYLIYSRKFMRVR